LTPQLFIEIALPTTEFPVADPVGVTRNSTPAGFDVIQFSLTRLPLAKTLMRTPARLPAATTFLVTVVPTGPNRRMPTRFPLKEFSLITLSNVLLRIMIPLELLLRNSFSLTVFHELPLCRSTPSAFP
jgi:hypothetical protein